MKSRLRKFLCHWVGHNWTMCGHIREVENVENTFIYDRHCKREGCKAHQNIGVHVIGGERYAFLDGEWDGSCKQR